MAGKARLAGQQGRLLFVKRCRLDLGGQFDYVGTGRQGIDEQQRNRLPNCRGVRPPGGRLDVGARAVDDRLLDLGTAYRYNLVVRSAGQPVRA